MEQVEKMQELEVDEVALDAMEIQHSRGTIDNAGLGFPLQKL